MNDSITTKKNGLLGVPFGLRANYFTMFLIDCIISNYVPPLLKSRGFSSMDIANINTFRFATVIVAPILYAILANKTNNRRLALIVGSWISGFTVLGLYANLGFTAFTILYCFQQFLQQGTATQLDALTLNTIKDSSDYGRMRIFGNFGFITTALVGGAIESHYGLTHLLGYMVFVQVLLTFSILTLPSDKNSIKGNDTKKTKERFPIKKSFVLLMIFVMLILVSQGIRHNFYVIYCRTIGFGAYVGILITIGPMSVMIAFIYGKNILPRFKLSHVLFVVGIMTAIRWLLQGYLGTHLYIMMFSQLFHVFSFGALHLSVMRYCKASLPKLHVGTAMGIYGSCGMGLGNIIGSQVSGLCWQYYTPQIAYTWMAGFAALGAIVALFIKIKDEKNNEPVEEQLKKVPAS